MMKEDDEGENEHLVCRHNEINALLSKSTPDKNIDASIREQTCCEILILSMESPKLFDADLRFS
jgi:hypothetical protein